MFKIGTFALGLTVLFASTTAGAESDCSLLMAKVADAVVANKPAAKIAELKAIREDCFKRETSEVGECNRAESNYTAVIKEMQDSCDSMGLRSSSHTGSIGCSFNIDQCRCAAKGLKETDKRYLECDKVDTTKMKYCPQITEAAQERMDKRRDKIEERLKDLREKLRGMEDDQGKGDDKSADAKRQARQARLAAEKEYAQGMAEVATTKNQKEQERIQKMNEFDDKMQASRTALRAQPLKDRNASRKLEASKSAIYIQCVSQAQVAVNAMQTDAVARVREGSYNRGTSNDIFRQVGLTDRQNWQREVSKRVAWCMASPEVKAQQDQANVQLDAEKDANQTESADAQAQLEQLQKQMSQIQAACTGGAVAANGEVVQSQSCRDQQDSNSKVKQLSDSRAAALKAAQEDEDEAAAAAQKAQNATLNKTGSLLGQINGEENQLRNMDAADTATASYPTTGGTSQERAKVLSDKFASVIDHAQRVNRCCDKSGSSIGTQTCNGAKTFLNEHGLTVQNLQTSSNGNPPRPAPRTGDPAGTTTGN